MLTKQKQSSKINFAVASEDKWSEKVWTLITEQYNLENSKRKFKEQLEKFNTLKTVKKKWSFLEA